jgi:hypothetical protein
MGLLASAAGKFDEDQLSSDRDRRKSFGIGLACLFSKRSIRPRNARGDSREVIMKKNMNIGLIRALILILLSSAIVIAQESIDWGGNAVSLRGKNNQRFTFSCHSGGSASTAIWGTDLYTDDTSICTAAVHTGHITTQSGGVVTIEIRPGAASYRASTRYGVTSKAYGGWHGSFIVVGAQSNLEEVELLNGAKIRLEKRQATWSTQADNLRGRNNQRFLFDCPARGTVSTRLWGTDLYTDDSSICTAAAHFGLITAASGGKVVIEIRPGASSYRGSTRAGIKSNSYGGWHGSFVLLQVKKITP